MTTIFLSGSRKITRLNEDIRERVRNIIQKNFAIILGDANGADKAFQGYLHEINYQNVTVYCSGSSCRNNLGEWETKQVFVDAKLIGRDFYTQKDKKMAEESDHGLILWDGKSAGSISNLIEMVSYSKSTALYFSPEKKFYTVSSLEDAKNLLKKCDQESLESINKKIKLNALIKNLEIRNQGNLFTSTT